MTATIVGTTVTVSRVIALGEPVTHADGHPNPLIVHRVQITRSDYAGAATFTVKLIGNRPGGNGVQWPHSVTLSGDGVPGWVSELVDEYAPDLEVPL